MKTTSPAMSADDERWRAEADFNRLKEAEDIKLDKKRHKRALAHGKRQIIATKRVMHGMSHTTDDEKSLAQGHRKL